MAASNLASRDELNAWVLATWARAVAFAASLLRDRAGAEDVVHDCYCRLLRKAEEYDLAHSGTKILLKAVSNACINRNTRERQLVSLDGAADGDGSAWEVGDPRAVEPAQVLLDQELEKQVAEGLSRLPVGQRAALELKSLGYSLQEVAETLEITPTNAGVLVHRARQALAQHLAPYVEIGERGA